jgi:PAS domain S-box-containing protein
MTSKKKPDAPQEVAELQRNPRLLLRLALIIAVYLIAFVILDFITKQFEELPGIVAWYPPAGLTYTLLLVFGVTFTPAVTIALFISSLFIYRMPQPTYLLLLWALIISLIYGLAAAFLRHRIRIDWQLRKLRDVIWLVFTILFVSALLAVLSVLGSALSSAMPRSEILRAIFDWWIGETVGVFTVAPFLLTYVMPGLKRFAEGQPVRWPAGWSFPRPTLSAVGQAASIVLTLYWVFGAPVLDEFHPLYLIALPLIWIAMQRGFKGFTIAILAMNMGVVLGMWLFRFDLARLGELELLMIVNCIIGLLMGAVVSERKQAEEAMRLSEDKYRTLVDEVNDGFYVADEAGVFTFVNPTLARMYGVESPQALVGRKSTDFFTQGIPAGLGDVYDSAMQTGRSPEAIKGQIKRPDGTSVFIEVKPVMIVKGGQIVGTRGVVRDVTERKRTEAERQALLEIMQGVASTENLPDLLELIRKSLAKVIYAENFFVVFQNKNSGLYEEVFAVDKYDPAMLPSKLEKSMTSYVFRTGEPLLLSRARFEELVARGEAELVGTNPAIWLGVPLKTPNETIGVMAVQNYEDPECYSERDKEFLSSVSAQVAVAIEHKRTEDSLRESEDKYRVLVTEINDGIFTTDDTGKLIFANPAMARMLGYENPDQLMGRNFREFVAPAMLNEFVGYFRQAMETGQFRGRAIAEVVRADGTNTVIEVMSAAIKEGSKVVGTHNVARDITERKRAEEEIKNQLEELQRWQNATLGRESRILDLKREVNELLGVASQPSRYPSAESQENKEK